MTQPPRAALHIAIFCRPLISGQVKTRLIAAFGAAGATTIYSQLVDRTLHTVAAAQQALSATASLWVAGDVAHRSVSDWAERHSLALPAYSQCEGDLGARMLHCLATLAEMHERVLLIGTDCPALNVADLRAASNALTPDCGWVFTPAEDGGYVLVGSHSPSAVPFENIAWSTAEVMAQTRRALKKSDLKWAETATRWDVDDAADVHRAINAGFIKSPAD
jgi:uncharacterized protein